MRRVRRRLDLVRGDRHVRWLERLAGVQLRADADRLHRDQPDLRSGDRPVRRSMHADVVHDAARGDVREQHAHDLRVARHVQLDGRRADVLVRADVDAVRSRVLRRGTASCLADASAIHALRRRRRRARVMSRRVRCDRHVRYDQHADVRVCTETTDCTLIGQRCSAGACVDRDAIVRTSPRRRSPMSSGRRKPSTAGSTSRASPMTSGNDALEFLDSSNSASAPAAIRRCTRTSSRCRTRATPATSRPTTSTWRRSRSPARRARAALRVSVVARRRHHVDLRRPRYRGLDRRLHDAGHVEIAAPFFSEYIEGSSNNKARRDLQPRLGPVLAERLCAQRLAEREHDSDLGPNVRRS